MRAVLCRYPDGPDQPGVLDDVEIDRPKPVGRDLLVEVRAVSVNPVDVKVRQRGRSLRDGADVLGFDAAGVVVETGESVSGFEVGDAVYYAGDITRPGTNAEFHLVDERIVGRKPALLDWGEAAALPLTAITAWEILFDRMDVARPVAGASSLLIIGGAGGVGSIAIQLARLLTDLTVLATTSRPQARNWITDLGAHHVLDHSRSLAAQVAEAGLKAPGFVLSTSHTARHLADIVSLIAPQGRFGLIDDMASLDVAPFKRKAVSTHWESMFTRSTFATPDLAEQGRVLNDLAVLLDQGRIKTTLSERLGPITAENLGKAHALIEAGIDRGKIVLEGFPPR
jgi:NADPH2:quinone reductase